MADGVHDAAIVIGIEKYVFVDHVPGARENAAAWQEYLTETRGVPPERVTLLRDEEASVEDIRKFVAQKAAQVDPGGRLWFVFIGHGAPSKDGSDGFLVGMDARQTAESIYERSLSRNELLKLLAKGRQVQTVVVLDSCFSGRSSSGRGLVSGLQPLVPMGGLPKSIDDRTILLTAGKSDEFAGPLPKATHLRPAFSYLTLGALRGWGADTKGRVTAQGVINYARKALSFAHDRTQTPQLELGSPQTILAVGHEHGPDLAKIDRQDTVTVQARSGNAGIEWVSIPGGTFAMGSGRGDAGPKHMVTVESFQLAKTPVTNKQYKACIDAWVCKPQNPKCLSAQWYNHRLGAKEPVICVNWNEAKTFAEWVGGRLPSEAEWEYAARSRGNDWRYPWGNQDPPTSNESFQALCQKAVVGGCGYVSVVPVCLKTAGNTEQGLCDMVGEVKEWVEDRYHDSYQGAPTDGSAWVYPVSYSPHVIRGMTWGESLNDPLYTRAGVDPENTTTMIGFRPAR
jgi:formylglycine-generating enzyme required for sulfatase activity